MANERAYTTRNTGTVEEPVWEVWFAKTVFDAVMMSDNSGETKNIKQYVDDQIAALIGGAPETYNTLKEIADFISAHKDVADALNAAIAQKADKTTATTAADGLMAAADKIKLENIAAEANKYVHPVTAGNKHIPAGGAAGQILGWDADGTAKWQPGQSYGPATTTADGLMAAEDKTKLDGIDTNANNYIHPEKHPATMITPDTDHQFLTDEEKAKLNSLPSIDFGSTYPASAPHNSLFFLVEA